MQSLGEDMKKTEYRKEDTIKQTPQYRGKKEMHPDYSPICKICLTQNQNGTKVD